MKITMENCTVYKSLSKPILGIESIPIRIVTFIFEQRKMIIPIAKIKSFNMSTKTDNKPKPITE